MILISAHQDRVKNDIDLSYINGKMTGLLDNFLGVFVSLTAITQDPNLSYLEMDKKIRLFFSKSEEWGTPYDLYPLTQKDIALVVDVASGKQYDSLDFTIENIYGFTDKQIRELKESLEWEGFRFHMKRYTGKPEEEDEAWYWRKKKIPTMSFIIPIKNPPRVMNPDTGKLYPETGWHSSNCSADLYSINRAVLSLRRLLCYLI